MIGPFSQRAKVPPQADLDVRPEMTSIPEGGPVRMGPREPEHPHRSTPHCDAICPNQGECPWCELFADLIGRVRDLERQVAKFKEARS